jgi:hypothetical protein
MCSSWAFHVDERSESSSIYDMIIENQLRSAWRIVEMSSIFRTDPEVYDDKKQKHLKRFHSKVVTK